VVFGPSRSGEDWNVSGVRIGPGGLRPGRNRPAGPGRTRRNPSAGGRKPAGHPGAATTGPYHLQPEPGSRIGKNPMITHRGGRPSDDPFSRRREEIYDSRQREGWRNHRRSQVAVSRNQADVIFPRLRNTVFFHGVTPSGFGFFLLVSVESPTPLRSFFSGGPSAGPPRFPAERARRNQPGNSWPAGGDFSRVRGDLPTASTFARGMLILKIIKDPRR